MQSVMTHDFSRAPQINAPRSKFDRSHGHKFTTDIDWIIPYYWDMVLPGDTFNMTSTIFARLSTPEFPIMDNMRLQTHFFFVPTRLLWTNFRKFCGEQEDPGDSIDFTIPVLSGALASGGDAGYSTQATQMQMLMNYLGVPDGIAPADVDISALPFRAYNRIYTEWFRDQNLIDSPTQYTGDGPDSTASHPGVFRRGKRHDYFTSALPWPQKGDAVSLPLGSSAPVHHPDTAGTGVSVYADVAADNRLLVHDDHASQVTVDTVTGAAATRLYADLSSATASTINDIREAFQVQKLLERDARAGTRYSELVANHFGVSFYDVSYRPEYLGGGSQNITITPTAATGGYELNRNVGDLGAYGTSAGSNHSFSKSFVEHGVVMGVMSITADLTYQQGLDRHLSHSTRYDYYWPSLAHLGEQEILNKEIYCDGSANDDLVFGYQERYAEYRYKPSKITGLFQSAATGTLEAWHLSQDFATLPTLGQTFIESTTDLDRCIRVPGEPHFIVDTFQHLICARPMPVFGVPGMIDHF